MKVFICLLMALCIPVTAMQEPPKQSAKDQPIKEAHKKQKKEGCTLAQFQDNDAKDSDWDDIASDSHFISDIKLERYKTISHQSPSDIVQSLKNNPDGWAYDSDEANETIKALEADSKDN